MLSTSHFLLIPTLLLGSYSSHAFSQNIDSAQLISEVVSAKPIIRATPRYPIDTARQGQEGWAAVSFIIEKDGSVSSLLVEDSSGNKKLERAARRAISKWTYSPALENGEPVQQCNQSVRIDFSLEQGGRKAGATRKFVRRYNEIIQHLNDKEYDLAKQQMAKLKAKPRWNLYEDAWFSYLEARYYGELGNNEKQLHSLNRSLSGHTGYLPESMLRFAYVQAFKLNISTNKLESALNNYQQLSKVEGSEQQINVLKPYVALIEQRISADKLIINHGRIGENLRWSHRLARNEFSLVDMNGTLRELEIRCKNKAFSYTIRPDQTWSVPASYGKCRVYVHGDANATFKLVELPKESKSV